MSTYKELAFNATIVNGFRESSLLGITDNAVFYEENDKIKKFENEQKALNYVFSTLDFSTKYDFYDVFYNPDYEKQEEDNKKYNDYIFVIVRKANAVHNQLHTYLTFPSDNSGELFINETEEHTLNEPRDLSKIQGLGLNMIMEDTKEKEEVIYYDIRDNFIYKHIDDIVTIDFIYNHVQDMTKKVRNDGAIVIVDVTGSELKSTFRDNLIINNPIDIYREFFGGTTKTEEDIDEDADERDNEKNKDVPNDSEYI